LLALLILTQLIFGGWLDGDELRVLGYLILPLLAWATFRFDARMWATAVVVVAFLAIWGTIRGHGPFAVPSLNTSLLLLQIFVCIIAAVTLILGGIVAERHRAEKRAEQATSRLQRSNRDLEEFAYVVSHDLKAPLRSIRQLSNWLVEDYAEALDDEGRETLGLLGQRAQRMSALIDGILEYSRAGRGELALSAIDCDELAREVVGDLNPPGHLAVSIDGILPNLPYVHTHMAQILHNLINNAITHHRGQRGEIVVSCVERADDWCFSVRDDGVGIDPRHSERIFQLFQTLGKAEATGSTGIGLALVKRLVERHGGRVWLESELDQGAIFYFTVPQDRTD
ncbi:MAG: ATP-binding protein, partial [Myxococcota bacterium]